MKKQIKKLNLNKRTISNLNSSEMNQKVGGAHTNFCDSERRCTQGCGTLLTCGPTAGGHTCNGHNTCL